MKSSILLIFLYFTIYGLLHSVTAATWFKSRLRGWIGPLFDRWYRLVYNVFAGISILPLFWMLAVLPDRGLYAVPSPWAWLMMAGQAAALVGAGITLLQTNLWHFAGLAQITAADPTATGSLSRRGSYAWVRHPLYTYSLLLIWLTPTMTVNLAVTYAIFTAYFYLGSIHEERRLVREFGEAYVRYQAQVPRLIPGLRRRARKL
ncbi:MAG: isoprenylcysteine carboxylmethyltransferase family protein [Caldilineaceae bacterium]|nr:isoprenylcysteine carboxylmethyltransferase family protein [Caldilineaceae bacterium]MBP8110467.1 isoprenylcysteine carboxylmethyltransferase family protein [Caldilineaceae bacterium]MBP8125497.1 isoprenylcysteine carboxylmethyltransferase family protein [Caldilineaceae bacterium]MBP9075162.1 isoprenylcysteine carboxylmethyltransferase family protein [Caldilineaceae bacterium]